MTLPPALLLLLQAPTPNVQDWSKLHFVYVATKTTDAEIIAY